MRPAFFSSLLLLLALSAGCGRQDGALRFRYWGDLEEIQIVDSLIKDFEAAHPGVKVRSERKPADRSYADLLLTEFASGSAPDVIFISTNDFTQFVGPRKFMDLGPFMEREPGIKLKDFYKPMTQAFSREGLLYALPRDVAPVACVYYNKALFDKAGLPYPKDGWNWQDLRRTAKALTIRAKNGAATQMGFADEWNLFESFVLSAGGGLVDDYMNPRRLKVDSPEALEGIKFRQMLLLQDKVMPLAADNQALNSGPSALFMNSRLAMLYSGIWKTPQFRQIKDFDWDIAYFPKGPTGKRGFTAGGSGYAISADTKKADLGWELVKFLAGPEGQRRLAASGLLQPALKKLARSPAFLDGKKPLNKKFLLEAAEIGVPAPQMERWQEYVTNVWNPTTDPIWFKDATPADAERLVREAAAKGRKKYFPEDQK